MTKGEFIDRLAHKTRIARHHAELVVEAIFACMEQSLRLGEPIEIPGFGTFQVRSNKGHEGRNPKTGKAIQVTPKRLPFFKVSKNLAAQVGGGNEKKLEGADSKIARRSRLGGFLNYYHRKAA